MIDEAEDAMAARVPEDEKDLRACLFCSLIKTANQFMQHGCENCEEFLEMADNADRMYQCTSTNFKVRAWGVRRKVGTAAAIRAPS